MKVGVCSTAILFGTWIRPLLVGCGLTFLAMLAAAGYLNMQGPAYFFLSVGGTGIHLVWQYRTVDLTNPRSCWGAYINSRYFLRLNLSLGCYRKLQQKWPTWMDNMGRFDGRLLPPNYLLGLNLSALQPAMGILTHICSLFLLSSQWLLLQKSRILVVRGNGFVRPLLGDVYHYF